MKLFRSIFFTLFLSGAITAGAYAQANSLKQISFVFDRSNDTSSVRLVGDNIDVSARFRSDTSPAVCMPCTPYLTLHFGPAFDQTGIGGASGTIDGVFYPNLFVYHSLQYHGPEMNLPKLWSKTLRVSAPVTLTGNLGIWTRAEDIGINSAAIYLHNNINFAGTGSLTVKKLLSTPNRLYSDQYLSFTFSYVENKAVTDLGKAPAVSK